ncbi:bifunctional 4'-phosphopantothenoylcysteine decarboxylase/phosphopantothenoylcysteine synthetase [Salimicrobium jeotgali]|uniref:Coenzyme A biosynthesis bifunctional protein CoaBC n=1 Tax=Salimicrobium jeotgali TaxID=1230341 RepID=K2GN93_9BACI|nr:bifunctional phosphopantothenoylcysteine decarboxylase/phosphopantothenate--cysteine ligase CoaBC [Salimicrobium jeotgali]AKG04627.1 bifunctional 4'-phosphopantothenoylcysteine decarboxylase/phosphopantothenoylcysteine synthetase [Salimicrobium jeotgali]EKE31879.1 pantothenate metabolism [Salimicrobium jeotgali]MBM7696158.1 phosphopantothenoylcysteine decarboxylase/phosphopantothenate--cysteine ligase [Salimicrobium jeotgali]
MLENKKIVLGVSGGIAAYKAASLTSKLTQQGAVVKVIMTDHAKNFVGASTFQALSRQPVYDDTFDEQDPEGVQHVDLADWADLFMLAPATANLIGKLANGIADDMLTTTLLATEAPVYIAPAMNVHMYQHPSVISNLKKLNSFGFKFIEPGDGYLACGYVGKGRLEEPETIIAVLENEMKRTKVLQGKRILITAGPTREKIDPVRFFSNPSTGKMGFALAGQAAEMGAEVTLISGPVNLETPPGVNRIDITSASDMFESVIEHFPGQDVTIKTAAVADYRPSVTYEHKMKKKDEALGVSMERTTDILKELGRRKETQFLVGFAAETQQVKEYGRQKLESKNLDAVVINDVSEEGSGFAADTNRVIWMSKRNEETLPLLDKQETAKEILYRIAEEMKGV